MADGSWKMDEHWALAGLHIQDLLTLTDRGVAERLNVSTATWSRWKKKARALRAKSPVGIVTQEVMDRIAELEADEPLTIFEPEPKAQGTVALIINETRHLNKGIARAKAVAITDRFLDLALVSQDARMIAAITGWLGKLKSTFDSLDYVALHTTPLDPTKGIDLNTEEGREIGSAHLATIMDEDMLVRALQHKAKWRRELQD